MAKKKRRKTGKFGHCVICNERRRLTKNHVPPSGAYRPGRIRISPIQESLGEATGKGRFSENGLWFDSICAQCNEQRLGDDYDRALAAFSFRTRQRSRSTLELPSVSQISCQPQKVARAIIGHMLSAIPEREIGREVENYRQGDAMRHYFLDRGLSLPKFLSVFVWHYPFERIAVVRNFVKVSGVLDQATGTLLKFYPLSFWVTHGDPPQIPFATNLLPHRTILFDEECGVPLDFERTHDEFFPEAASDEFGATMFSGDRSLYAVPRRNKGSRIKRL